MTEFDMLTRQTKVIVILDETYHTNHPLLLMNQETGKYNIIDLDNLKMTIDNQEIKFKPSIYALSVKNITFTTGLLMVNVNGMYQDFPEIS